MGKIKDLTIPDDGPDVIHDALCTWMPDIYGPEDTGLVMEFPCFCVLIDKVRKNERLRCIGYIEDVDRRLEYRDGDREMYLEGLYDALNTLQVRP